MMRRGRVALALAGLGVALLPSTVAAHPVRATAGAGAPLEAWAQVAGTALLLGVTAGLYAVGLRRLWAQAGAGRGVSRLEAWAFGAGITVLAVTLLGPLVTSLTDGFAAHMAQHLLLVVVAAPLLVAGRPGVVFAWALRGARGRVALRAAHRLAVAAPMRAMSGPAAVFVIYVAVFWGWHLPVLYDAAERYAPVHVLEHATFLGAALLFWWRVRTLAAGASSRQVLAAGLLFAVMFPGLVLGAFLTFAREPLYASQLAAGAGVEQVLDQQQLGGLLMLMLGGMVYVGVALALLLRLVGHAPATHIEEGSVAR